MPFQSNSGALHNACARGSLGSRPTHRQAAVKPLTPDSRTEQVHGQASYCTAAWQHDRRCRTSSLHCIRDRRRQLALLARLGAAVRHERLGAAARGRRQAVRPALCGRTGALALQPLRAATSTFQLSHPEHADSFGDSKSCRLQRLGGQSSHAAELSHTAQFCERHLWQSWLRDLLSADQAGRRAFILCSAMPPTSCLGM